MINLKIKLFVYIVRKNICMFFIIPGIFGAPDQVSRNAGIEVFKTPTTGDCPGKTGANGIPL